MSLRHEFVLLAQQEGRNIRQLCRRYGISPTTAYKWLHRFAAAGPAGLQERSRRPHHSPRRAPAATETAVLQLRQQHPAWGGRKLRARLQVLGQPAVPSASTITAILARHQLIDPAASEQHRAFRRFEHAQPNELWQMDFKGEFALRQQQCYPLTVLDDHSRFALGLVACANQQRATTQAALTQVFRRYGLPQRITMDNGAPWGSYHGQHERYTEFVLWLLRLGIRVSHSRPHHPQTQGKDERFHRTLKLELLGQQQWHTLAQCQQQFDRWRDCYNCERPHEALALAVPATRYVPSPRSFPEQLPPIEYAPGDLVRKVGYRGQIKHQQQRYFLGTAFRGLPVALRPTTVDGRWDVYFCQQRIAVLDRNALPSLQRQVSTMSPYTCP